MVILVVLVFQAQVNVTKALLVLKHNIIQILKLINVSLHVQQE